MEIIDEEGFLFGVINVIDAVVVLLVLSLLGVGSTMLLDAGTAETGEKTTATVTVEIRKVEPYVARAITTGDYGEEMTVVNRSAKPAGVIVKSSDGEIFEREHPRLRTVTVVVKLEVERRPDGLVYRNAPLRVGRELQLSSDRVSVTGVVTDVET